MELFPKAGKVPIFLGKGGVAFPGDADSVGRAGACHHLNFVELVGWMGWFESKTITELVFRVMICL